MLISSRFAHFEPLNLIKICLSPLSTTNGIILTRQIEIFFRFGNRFRAAFSVFTSEKVTSRGQFCSSSSIFQTCTLSSGAFSLSCIPPSIAIFCKSNFRSLILANLLAFSSEIAQSITAMESNFPPLPEVSDPPPSSQNSPTLVGGVVGNKTPAPTLQSGNAQRESLKSPETVDVGITKCPDELSCLLLITIGAPAVVKADVGSDPVAVETAASKNRGLTPITIDAPAVAKADIGSNPVAVEIATSKNRDYTTVLPCYFQELVIYPILEELVEIACPCHRQSGQFYGRVLTSMDTGSDLVDRVQANEGGRLS